MDYVDWEEINKAKNSLKIYKSINQNDLLSTSVEILSKIDFNHIDKNKLPSENLFSIPPVPIGDFKMLAGSPVNDILNGQGGDAIFAGYGDDTLIGNKTVINDVIYPVFLSGGQGNDKYKIEKGSFTLIFDASDGNDLLDINILNPKTTDIYYLDDNQSSFGNSEQGYFATDGKTKILLGDLAEIEQIKFNNKIFTPPESEEELGQSELAKYVKGISSTAFLQSQGFFDLTMMNINLDPESIDSYLDIINDFSLNSQLTIASQVINSKLKFGDDPLPLGNTKIIPGTHSIDYITGKPAETIFAGKGDDFLFSYASVNNESDTTILSGGNGNDTYKVYKGSHSIIYDIGDGNDTLDINNISKEAFLYVDDTWAFVTDSNTSVLIFENSEIEKFKFGGQTYNQLDLLPIDNTVSGVPLSNLETNGLINLNLIGLSTDKDSLDTFISSAQFNNANLI